MKYDLSATEVENGDQATTRANSDVVKVGDNTFRFGNTVTTGDVNVKAPLGDGGTKDIRLDLGKVTALHDKAPGNLCQR